VQAFVLNVDLIFTYLNQVLSRVETNYLLGGNVNIVKNNVHITVQLSKESGLHVNIGKTESTPRSKNLQKEVTR